MIYPTQLGDHHQFHGEVFSLELRCRRRQRDFRFRTWCCHTQRFTMKFFILVGSGHPLKEKDWEINGNSFWTNHPGSKRLGTKIYPLPTHFWVNDFPFPNGGISYLVPFRVIRYHPRCWRRSILSRWRLKAEVPLQSRKLNFLIYQYHLKFTYRYIYPSTYLSICLNLPRCINHYMFNLPTRCPSFIKTTLFLATIKQGKTNPPQKALQKRMVQVRQGFLDDGD